MSSYGPAIPDSTRSWRTCRVVLGLALAGAVVSLCAVSLPSASAQGATGRALLPRSAATSFCAHFGASSVSATVGHSVKLLTAQVVNGSDECIFEGAIRVIISQRPKVTPAGELSSLAKAEAYLKAESPKGVKITFQALPKLGPTAFSWTYDLNGGELVGVGDSKGTKAWGALVGGSPKLLGSPSSHVTALEHLIDLDIAA